MENEELQNKINELEARIKEYEYLLRNHKHSGKETIGLGEMTTITGDLIPMGDGMHSLGRDSNKFEWVRVNAISYKNDIFADGTKGWTGTITARNKAGDGTCTITVKKGIVTGTTCT